MTRPNPPCRLRRLPPRRRVPTADDLLAHLRADWPRVRAREGFAERVMLAVRRLATAADRPRRLRSRFLLGAACAFLVAFVAGLVEAGRGGVRADAHAPAHVPIQAPADPPAPAPPEGPAKAAAGSAPQASPAAGTRPRSSPSVGGRAPP